MGVMLGMGVILGVEGTTAVLACRRQRQEDY